MAFKKKTWLGRIAEFPNRRRLTKEDGSSELVTVSREEGQISQEGDAFSPDNFNDLETRIDDAINELNEGILNVDTIHVEIDVIESEGNIGKCYGTKVLNLSKYGNVKAIVPVSAVCKTSAGTVGILGKYSHDTPTGESVWALSAPIVGTYVCDFLILYTEK